MLLHAKRAGIDNHMSLSKRIRRSFSLTFGSFFSPLTLFIWLAAIVVATIAGPFGTFAVMDAPQRALYWLVVVSLSVVVGYGTRALALALVGQDRPILFDVVMVALMTVVLTPMVWFITGTVRKVPAVELQPLLTFAGYVMLCTAVIVVGRRVVPGFEPRSYDFLPEPEARARQSVSAEPEPRLSRRLSPTLRGRILRLTANDHLVEVVTERGAETLRMRLTDAVAEMEPVPGCCVHRSHWVAHAAITRVERETPHKMFVVLVNEDRIPVSRKYRCNLEEAGLI